MNLYRYPLEIRAYCSNIVWNGGSIGASTLNALSKFVNSLKLTPIWTKLDEIYPLCGRGIASACVKLKFVATPYMTNHNFIDEDFEEWGPNAGLTPDGFSKYLDINFSAAALRDDCHLCYIEQQPATDAAVPRTALGVTDGSLEWSMGAIDATADRSAILGSPLCVAATPAAYADWSSLYIANRESPTSLRLYKRTHLKDTEASAAVTSPKPALNLFLGARNNAGIADQPFKNRIRYASVGQALTPDEVIHYYQLVQALQDAIGRAV